MDTARPLPRRGSHQRLTSDDSISIVTHDVSGTVVPSGSRPTSRRSGLSTLHFMCEAGFTRHLMRCVIQAMAGTPGSGAARAVRGRALRSGRALQILLIDL